MKELYLDDSATTKVDSKVMKVMLPYFTKDYGNPSSSHELGERAEIAINKARMDIAKTINCKPQEIVFTSGVTEANNLALFGIARAYPNKKKIIISAIEHASIVEPCIELEKNGYNIVKTPVNVEGLVNVDEIERVIDNKTLIVSVMHANNVIGSIQNIAQIGELCKRKGVLFHTDAAQSLGKVAIDVRKMNIDLLSAGAHKIRGPKGIGILYVKEGTKIEPIIYGGGQERGLRGGTENVSGIAGFAEALKIIQKKNFNKIRAMRDNMAKELGKFGKINGPKARLPGNLHITFPRVDAGSLVSYLSNKKIYISTGSACESRQEKEDHVLKAIGLNRSEIDCSVRISFDDITNNDVSRVVKEIKNALNHLRA